VQTVLIAVYFCLWRLISCYKTFIYN